MFNLKNLEIMRSLFFYIFTFIFISTSYSQEIGKDHNNALEYIYQQLVEEDGIVNEEFLLKTKKHTIFYHENVSPITKDLEILDKKDFDKIFEEGIHQLYENSKERLSDNQLEFIEQIDKVASINKIKLNDVLENLNKIEKDALKELNDDEYVVVGYALDVAKNTYNYWDSNLDKWIALADKKQENSNKSMSIDWGSVGRADVRGAVGGFIRGLFGGNPLGGAASGAVAASGAELFMQILDQL